MNEEHNDATTETLKLYGERLKAIRTLGESIQRQKSLIEEKQDDLNAEKKVLKKLLADLSEISTQRAPEPSGQMKMDWEPGGTTTVKLEQKHFNVMRETVEKINQETVYNTPERLAGMKMRCEYLLENVDDPDFDDNFVRKILNQIETKKQYTESQRLEIENVERIFLD